MNTLICKQGLRREQVRRQEALNGLDYLETGYPDLPPDDPQNQKYLRVFLLGKAQVDLTKDNILIEGGQRIRNIQVVSVEIQRVDFDFDDYLDVIVDKVGDFSNYTLRVVEKDEQGRWKPHSKFDPRYDRIKFNFKLDCPNDLDCKAEVICPVEPATEPDINYLAKDYAGFRRLILDRLALTVPDWRERHVPDIGIALIEVLAYVGDHLSYYQDAAATEAYLDTARQRISVRRHVRLVDYRLHEGCNARAWLCVEVANDLPPIDPKDIYFVTRLEEAQGVLVEEAYLRQLPASRYEVFEPVTTEAIRFFKDHNRMAFYTWGDRECCLPKGATRATLVGKWMAPEPTGNGVTCPPKTGPAGTEAQPAEAEGNTGDTVPELHLKPGDVLVFEEVVDPESGFQFEEIIDAETGELKDAVSGYRNDANPKHRHAVRLTGITADVDPLNGLDITHITWEQADALPFPLCLSALGPPPECKFITYASIACGNVVLVDHGRTVDEDLGDVPEGSATECCKEEGLLAEAIRNAGRYNPALPLFPVTVREPPVSNAAAVYTLAQNVQQAVAQISLSSLDENSVAQAWLPQADLLASQADDAHFVAELDDEGRAHLRFGNGELGRKPEAGMQFQAAYRIGNGTAGNVGAESISHVVFKDSQLDGFTVVRNPMPAQGGTEREPLAEAKLFAPGAFRKELQRAVIADDYAAIVLREFKQTVQNAVARLRWNGSWYEVWVAVDAFGREQAGQDLLDRIACRLHRYRRIGHDLVVKSAQRVPLAIGLLVCVRPDYLRGHVKAELLKVFSNQRLADGRLGFFHADNLTFGDDVYLSKIVAAAQAVQGVQSVEVTQLQRFGELKNNEIENGLLPLGPLEIARLDNDPNFPENGKLVLDLRGGR